MSEPFPDAVQFGPHTAFVVQLAEGAPVSSASVSAGSSTSPRAAPRASRRRPSSWTSWRPPWGARRRREPEMA